MIQFYIFKLTLQLTDFFKIAQTRKDKFESNS